MTQADACTFTYDTPQKEVVFLFSSAMTARRVVVFLTVLLLASGLMPNAVAQNLDPAYESGTSGNSDDGNLGDCDPDSRTYCRRNCTSYTAYRLAAAGVAASDYQNLHNGGDWFNNAQARGIPVGSTPRVGAAAVIPGTQARPEGHVTFVESVNADGSINVASYNGYTESFYPETNTRRYSHFIYFSNTTNGSSGASSVGTRLVADVNGDARADAVVMFKDSGTAMVALSADNHFGPPGAWSNGHSVNATRYFLADVNGDGRADLVAFRASNGSWHVSLSSGGGFWTATEWAVGHGVGTSRQWLADMDGDRKADIVTFDAANGDWYVSTSSGSGFWSPRRIATGHGVTSTDQAVADFSGDGLADLGVWFGDTGAWYIVGGNGGQWSSAHGQSSDRRLTGDATGDGKADAAYFFVSNGHIDAGTSSGSGFWAPIAWAHQHGPNTADQFLADVNADGKADFISFDQANGDWRVSLSSGTGFWSPELWLHGHGAGS